MQQTTIFTTSFFATKFLKKRNDVYENRLPSLFLKSDKIWNWHLLQIIDRAFWLNNISVYKRVKRLPNICDVVVSH